MCEDSSANFYQLIICLYIFSLQEDANAGGYVMTQVLSKLKTNKISYGEGCTVVKVKAGQKRIKAALEKKAKKIKRARRMASSDSSAAADDDDNAFASPIKPEPPCIERFVHFSYYSYL